MVLVVVVGWLVWMLIRLYGNILINNTVPALFIPMSVYLQENNENLEK